MEDSSARVRSPQTMRVVPGVRTRLAQARLGPRLTGRWSEEGLSQQDRSCSRSAPLPGIVAARKCRLDAGVRQDLGMDGIPTCGGVSGWSPASLFAAGDGVDGFIIAGGQQERQCSEVFVVHSSYPEGPWPAAEVVGPAAVYGTAQDVQLRRQITARDRRTKAYLQPGLFAMPLSDPDTWKKRASAGTLGEGREDDHHG